MALGKRDLHFKCCQENYASGDQRENYEYIYEILSISGNMVKYILMTYLLRTLNTE